MMYRLKRILMLNSITIIACALVVCCTNIKNNESYFNLLTNDSIKYWDPYYTFKKEMLGKGWCFSQDSIFIEYTYKEGIRSEIDYGDIIWDKFYFRIVKDTLYFKNYNDYKFLIMKLNKDSLIVQDIGQLSYSYLDSFLFVKAADQVTAPF